MDGLEGSMEACCIAKAKPSGCWAAATAAAVLSHDACLLRVYVCICIQHVWRSQMMWNSSTEIEAHSSDGPAVELIGSGRLVGVPIGEIEK